MIYSQLITRLRWEFLELLQALRTFRFYRTLLAMAVGITLAAVTVNGILIPRHLAASGVSGISLLLFYLFGRPGVGMIYLVLNIPLFIIGWREYALKYVAISILGVLMFAGALELTRTVIIPAPDPLMASVIAGILVGFGSGLYLRLGGSAGGLDILATYLKKRLSLPMGTTLNAVNAFNLVGAYLLYGMNVAFYSAVFMWVNAYVLDKVQTGFDRRHAVLIITSKPDAVAQQVMRRLDRGVTFFHATGGHSGAAEIAVYTVINLYELGRLKELLFETDEGAFVVVYNTSEVIGKRFLSWEDQGYRRPMDRRHATPPS